MHFLSKRNHSEFLAVPSLVRATMAEGQYGLEPTLLIKTSSLSLKYLIQLRLFHVVLIGLQDQHLAYCVKVDDDPIQPSILWSVLETEDERSALEALVSTSQFFVFLFNELAVNVSWATTKVNCCEISASELIRRAKLGSSNCSSLRNSVAIKLDAYLKDSSLDHAYTFKSLQIEEWNRLQNHYISKRTTNSLISLFEADEGNQQEEAAYWLIDELDPAGAAKNPTVYLDSGARELCDLVLSHSFGCFLFESKSLSIISRNELPSRNKLARNLTKHVLKAEQQLSGAIRSLRKGYRVTDEAGNNIVVERNTPAHAIILVPDLSLLTKESQFDGDFLRKFMKQTGCFLQLLDLKELLRMVQAAEILKKHGETVTKLMCFDAHLINRFEFAIEQDTADCEFLLRIEGV